MNLMTRRAWSDQVSLRKLHTLQGHQPRERHSSMWGFCSPSVESSPWPG
jgi:hypothetical protein